MPGDGEIKVMSKGGDDHLPGERIAKAIARAGLASRREAEAWIAAGRVAVNGETISSPARNITPDDRVTVDGTPLPQRERTRLLLYHKPRGLVTTHADPQGRPTVFAALPKHLPRLISVGRLDANTEGLLLLTNDGGLARLLELPATGWMRRYRVRANGRVAPERLDSLRRGITIDGVRYGPIEARLDREQGANIWLTFAMREGKNREVKNVLGHLGLAVNRLIRVSFGPFQLGDLPAGAIEEVRTRHLREQLGEKLAAEAGLDFAGPMSIPPPKGKGGEQSGTGGVRDADARHAPAGRSHALAANPPLRGRDKKKRRHGPDRLGEPEKARREHKRGRRPFRGKTRD
jgi:23S rRNA pseudouridine2605 synthase